MKQFNFLAPVFYLHGFACRHVMVVLSSRYNYTETSQHDFAPCYWKEYYHYYSLVPPNFGTTTLQEKSEVFWNNDLKGLHHDPVSIA